VRHVEAGQDKTLGVENGGLSATIVFQNSATDLTIYRTANRYLAQSAVASSAAAQPQAAEVRLNLHPDITMTIK
jgi:hypothetical protein